MELELYVLEASGTLDGGRVEIAMGHGDIDTPAAIDHGPHTGGGGGIPAVSYLGAVAIHALIQLAGVLSIVGFMTGLTLRAIVEMVNNQIRGRISPEPVTGGGASIAVEFTLENR